MCSTGCIALHHLQERLEAFIEHVSIPPPLIFGIVQVCAAAALCRLPCKQVVSANLMASGHGPLTSRFSCVAGRDGRGFLVPPCGPYLILHVLCVAGRDGRGLPGPPGGPGQEAGLCGERRHSPLLSRLQVRVRSGWRLGTCCWPVAVCDHWAAYRAHVFCDAVTWLRVRGAPCQPVMPSRVLPMLSA